MSDITNLRIHELIAGSLVDRLYTRWYDVLMSMSH